jgi:hypothetical protein
VPFTGLRPAVGGAVLECSEIEGHGTAFPDDFRDNWLFVGSNLGLLYKGEPPDVPTFHNIYLNPEAHPSFHENEKFPDPTTPVMDIYQNQDREEQNIVTRGSF